jgi:hypothetical protein
MSATRDKNQKGTFVYSNLYQIFKKGQESAASVATPAIPAQGEFPGLAVSKGKILKAQSLSSPEVNRMGVQVSPYKAAELIGKRVQRPQSLPRPATAVPRHAALDGLKENLKTLNDLHSRLRFMLQELEDLIKE